MCGQDTSKTHGYYRRCPQDLPCDGRTVVLQLRVRRFLCVHPSCSRRTFVERFPHWLPIYSRLTKRVKKLIQYVGLEVGGQKGQRLLARFRIAVSGATVIRIVRRESLDAVISPRVVGVDDWAFRRGRNYGTIIVDLEARRVIDLLPDRQAATLQTWLEAHDTIQFVSRDRSNEYASAIQAGCPNAVQIADRWHLLANARELAERYLRSVYSELQPFTVPREKSPLFLRSRPPFRRAKSEAHRSVASQNRRDALFQEVQQLRRQGLGIRAISRHLRLHRNTVKRHFDAKTSPTRSRQKQRRSILDPYIAYLTRRQQQGYENAMQLWREIAAQGYSGTHRQVQRWLQQRRRHPSPNTPKVYIRYEQDVAKSRQVRLPSLRELSWVLVKSPTHCGERDKLILDHLVSHPQVALVHSLLRQFVTMVEGRQPARLAAWVQKMQASRVAILVNFANGLRQDFQAVQAAMTYPWSNGQTEGQVNRLKFIKRQMYGRANFDLLRLRVLHSSSST